MFHLFTGHKKRSFGYCFGYCFADASSESLHIIIIIIKLAYEMYQAWELSAKMQILAAVKLTFHRENKLSAGKEIGSTRHAHAHKESTGFSSPLNTHKTYGAHSHVAISHLSHVTVKTVACCYSCG